MGPIELWIATSNQGKLNEFRNLLHAETKAGWSIKTYKDMPVFSPPPENGATFLDNARIKAKSFSRTLNQKWVLAEDSGLVVEGLNGLPGIHSARYAGANASDAENIAKLLKIMQIKPMSSRAAKFVCTMVIYTPAGEEWIFEGELKGEIAKAPKGAQGFGYDPVFIPEGKQQTLAELGVPYKNEVSHRARALKKFTEKLRTSL